MSPLRKAPALPLLLLLLPPQPHRLPPLHRHLLILEAMKMENEISAPQDGTIASVNVRKGDVVNSGDLLITMN